MSNTHSWNNCQLWTRERYCHNEAKVTESQGKGSSVVFEINPAPVFTLLFHYSASPKFEFYEKHSVASNHVMETEDVSR